VAAKRELTAALPLLHGASASDLETLGDVVLAGELVDGVAPIAAEFTARGAANEVRRDRRFATLGAALVHDASTIPDGGTDRDHRTATAIRAELAGDHATALSILSALVADPSAHWDYAERAALIRNLRATDDQPRLAAIYDDTLRPAIPRAAMVVLRRVCTVTSPVRATRATHPSAD
jgi:hypothetical protein